MTIQHIVGELVLHHSFLKTPDSSLPTFGVTASITGFVVIGAKVKGTLSLKDDFTVQFSKELDKLSEATNSEKVNAVLICPKCKQGTMLKGYSAFGCSRYKEGCKFIIPFAVLEKDYNSKELTNIILNKMV